MPRVRLLILILASLVTFSLTGVGTASAAGTITFDASPGTGAPPATLGPYPMTPFGLDSQPFGFVTGVTGPSGDVAFSPALDHVRIGQGWATWSHGYAGDVYPTFGGLSATLALPSGTSAFYFYAEPNPFAVFNITAVAQDGTSSGPIAVDGFAGAQYFGFYSTGSEHIASINISSNVDFAIGEFGIGATRKTTSRSATRTPPARATRRSSPGPTARATTATARRRPTPKCWEPTSGARRASTPAAAPSPATSRARSTAPSRRSSRNPGRTPRPTSSR